MTVKTVYLVVRADGSVRVTKRLPQLAIDEVAWELNVKIPDGWGRIGGTIEVAVPSAPSTSLVGEAIVSDEPVDLPA